MTRNLNKELKKYYREISKALSGSKEKKIIVAQIKSSVRQYIQDNTDATFNNIVQKFGSPSEIVEQYYDDNVAKDLSAQLNKHKKIGLVMVIVFILIILGLIWVVLFQSNSTVVHEKLSPVVTEADNY